MNTIAMAMTLVSVALALTVRYAAQGLVATLLGDGTPARDRRLTLNPARHLSAIGGVVALISALPASGGIPVGIGWGRPVRADVSRFSVNPNTGLIFIAVAGIATNLILGALIGLGLGLIPMNAAQAGTVSGCLLTGAQGGPLQGCLQPWLPGWELRLVQFAYTFAAVNIVIGLLNIIPLFPLDGYNIAFALLPERPAIAYRNSQSFQELILVGILFLLPLLLAFSGSPLQVSPLDLLQQFGLSIVQRLSNLPAALSFAL